MSASERIEKYYEDATRLIASNCPPPKLIAEVRKLQTWLQKHQSESIPDGAKKKLMSAVELYYRYGTNRKDLSDVADATMNLVGDLLKLPEGKLISAKSKSKALRWLSNQSGGDEDDNDGVGNQEYKPRRWIVVEIAASGNKVSLMDPEGKSDELLENVMVPDGEVMSEIKKRFECDDVTLLVDVINGLVVSAFVDGESL